jgi:hypothetical protein
MDNSGDGVLINPPTLFDEKNPHQNDGGNKSGDEGQT